MTTPNLKPLTCEALQEILRLQIASFFAKIKKNTSMGIKNDFRVIKDTLDQHFVNTYLKNQDLEPGALAGTEAKLQEYWQFLVSGQALGTPETKLREYENSIKKAVAPLHVLSLHRTLLDKIKTLFNMVIQSWTGKKDPSDAYILLEQLKRTTIAYAGDELVQLFHQTKPAGKVSLINETKDVVLADNSSEAVTTHFKKNLTHLENLLSRYLIAYYLNCINFFSPDSKIQLTLEQKITDCIILSHNLVYANKITAANQQIIQSMLDYKAGSNRSQADKAFTALNQAITGYSILDRPSKLSVPMPTLTPKNTSSNIQQEIIANLNVLQSILSSGQIIDERKKASIQKLILDVQDLNKKTKTYFGIQDDDKNTCQILLPQATPRPKLPVIRSLVDIHALKNVKDVFWNENEIQRFNKNRVKLRLPEEKKYYFKFNKIKNKVVIIALVDIAEKKDGYLRDSLGVLELVIEVTFSGPQDESLISAIKKTISKALKASYNTSKSEQPINIIQAFLVTLGQELQQACSPEKCHDVFGFIESRLLTFVTPLSSCSSFKPGDQLNDINVKQAFYVTIPFETRYYQRKNQGKPIIGINAHHVVQFDDQKGIVHAVLELGNPNQILSANISVKTIDTKIAPTIRIDPITEELTEYHNSLRQPISLTIDLKGHLNSISKKTPKTEAQKKQILELLFSVTENKTGKMKIEKSCDVKNLLILLEKFKQSDALGKVNAAQNVIEFLCLMLNQLGSIFTGSAKIDGFVWDSRLTQTFNVTLGPDGRSSVAEAKLTIESADYFEIGEGKQSILFNLKSLVVDVSSHREVKDLSLKAALLKTNLETNINHELLKDKFATLKCDLIGQVSFPYDGHISDVGHVLNTEKYRAKFNALLEEIAKQDSNKNLIEKGISKTSDYYHLCQAIVDAFKEARTAFFGDIIFQFILPNRQFTLTATVNIGRETKGLGILSLNLRHTGDQKKLIKTNLLQYQMSDTALGPLVIGLEDIKTNLTHQTGTDLKSNVKISIFSPHLQKKAKFSCFIKASVNHVNGEDATETLIQAFDMDAEKLNTLYHQAISEADPNKIIEAINKGSAFYQFAEAVLVTIRLAEVRIKGSLNFVIQLPDNHKKVHSVILSIGFDTGTACDFGLGTFTLDVNYKNPHTAKDLLAKSTYYPLSTNQLGILLLRLDQFIVKGAIGNKSMGNIAINIGIAAPNTNIITTTLQPETISVTPQPEKHLGNLGIFFAGELSHATDGQDIKYALINSLVKYRQDLAQKFDSVKEHLKNIKTNHPKAILDLIKGDSELSLLADSVVTMLKSTQIKVQGPIKFKLNWLDAHKTKHSTVAEVKFDSAASNKAGDEKFTFAVNYTNPYLPQLITSKKFGTKPDSITEEKPQYYPLDLGGAGPLLLRIDHLDTKVSVGEYPKVKIYLDLGVKSPKGWGGDDLNVLSLMLQEGILQPTSSNISEKLEIDIAKAFEANQEKIGREVKTVKIKLKKDTKEILQQVDTLFEESDAVLGLAQSFVKALQASPLKTLKNLDVDLDIDLKQGENKATLHSNFKIDMEKNNPIDFHLSYVDPNKLIVVPINAIGQISLGHLEVNLKSPINPDKNEVTGTVTMIFDMHEVRGKIPYTPLTKMLDEHNKKRESKYSTFIVKLDGTFHYPKNILDSIRDIHAQIRDRAAVFVKIYDYGTNSPNVGLINQAMIALLTNLKDCFTQAKCRLQGKLELNYQGKESSISQDRDLVYGLNFLLNNTDIGFYFDTAWKKNVIGIKHQGGNISQHIISKYLLPEFAPAVAKYVTTSIDSPSSLATHNYAYLPAEEFLKTYPGQIFKAGVDFEALRHAGQRLAFWHVAFLTIPNLWHTQFQRGAFLYEIPEAEILAQIMKTSQETLPFWEDVLFEDDVFIHKAFYPFESPEKYFEHLFKMHRTKTQQQLHKFWFTGTRDTHITKLKHVLSVFNSLKDPKHQALLGSGYGLSDRTPLFVEWEDGGDKYKAEEVRQLYLDMLAKWESSNEIAGREMPRQFWNELFCIWQAEAENFIKLYKKLTEDLPIDMLPYAKVDKKFSKLKNDIEFNLEVSQIYEMCANVQIYTQSYLNWLHLVQSALTYGQALTKEHLTALRSEKSQSKVTNLFFIQIEHKPSIDLNPYTTDYLTNLATYFDECRKNIIAKLENGFNPYQYQYQVQASIDTMLHYLQTRPYTEFFLDEEHKAITIRKLKQMLNVRGFLPEKPGAMKEVMIELLETAENFRQSILLPLQKYYASFIKRKKDSEAKQVYSPLENRCASGIPGLSQSVPPSVPPSMPGLTSPLSPDERAALLKTLETWKPKPPIKEEPKTIYPSDNKGGFSKSSELWQPRTHK